MGKLALILGGARSGKSRFAQSLARQLAGDEVLFVATAEAGDAEMSERIQHHQSERPEGWQLREWPRDVGMRLKEETQSIRVILVDCLTLWISNLLCAYPDDTPFDEIEQTMRQELQTFLDAIKARTETTILVSGEVGQGIVPESSLARRFRDLLGWANQTIAKEAEATYLLVAGKAIDIGKLQLTTGQCANAIGETGDRHD